MHKDTQKSLFLLCRQQIFVMHRKCRLSETQWRQNFNTCYESKVPCFYKFNKLLRCSVILGDITLLIYMRVPP